MSYLVDAFRTVKVQFLEKAQLEGFTGLPTTMKLAMTSAAKPNRSQILKIHSPKKKGEGSG